jgi:hypothetical protein
MNYLKTYGVILVVAAVTFLAGKYSGSTKIETREVEKIVYRESQRENQSTSTRTKEITMPNGTVVKETISNTHTQKETEIDLTKERELVRIETNRPDWRLGVTYVPAIAMIQDQNVTIDIQRRIFSEIYIGLAVSTQKTLGVSFSIGF